MGSKILGRPENSRFLPVNSKEMKGRGWESCDFIFISGDAYVDHPSFAVALVSRYLEAQGFRVGVIPQPDWKTPESYTVLGRPRLGFLVGPGAMDSMMAHYTAARKPRSEDAYSPGGKAGFRPDRATLKYVECIRAAYKDIPVIIGGIEASLRRFAHYDYWSDTVRRSILLDSKADILVYGMGERPILEIARRLQKGEPVSTIRDVRGTCVRSHGQPPEIAACVRLPDYEAVKGADPGSLRAYAEHFMLQKLQGDPQTAKPLAEKSDGDRWVIQNPPAFPLIAPELDSIYELPYQRRAHPMYDAAGGIPGLKEVQFSLVSSRGCFGGCSFCAITSHQGRAISSRSRESLVREAETLARHRDFKGYIHDVGGPTANFYRAPCKRQAKGGFCPEKECLYPKPCPQLKADHRPYIETLTALRNIDTVKKVFIRSGIRFDYLELDTQSGQEFLETLCKYHVSGQLKVAPEHITPGVLAAMGKGKAETYEKFREDYAETNRRLGLKQYLIPYFISSHPGSSLADAVELALFMKKSHFVPDQVQDFYPSPGTLSTVMYHTGLDPRTMESISVPRGEREKRLQRALLQFNHAEQKALVLEALRMAGREDLIGNGAECLVRK
ncbi:radical SAM N- domain protein [Treponema primitia ZAS-2]|uniref:Radical SAM N-domain protein n=1 Tax=Treponema primitia (strain ATCC BAA-887 / DSM 12427 / ZAS-2) TaxID=545694 RepID=F5YKN1_TREPZ|nr:YgiQ family radical SAM protein [Treponema primitia]AEF85092.1 radical SAM N- domain protein [Treponema primitia ZAS-2]